MILIVLASHSLSISLNVYRHSRSILEPFHFFYSLGFFFSFSLFPFDEVKHIFSHSFIYS